MSDLLSEFELELGIQLEINLDHDPLPPNQAHTPGRGINQDLLSSPLQKDWRISLQRDSNSGGTFEVEKDQSMESKRLLNELCRKNGIAFEDGLPLLPMVERALQSPREARIRLLKLVERTLRLSEEEIYPSQLIEVAHSPDVLKAVARVLHDWNPPEDFLDGAA